MSILTEVKGKHASSAVIYHALYAYFFCRLTVAKLAQYFGKAENTIRSWIDRYEKEGLVGRKHLAAALSKFSLEERVWVYEYFKSQPTKYLKEATASFKKRFKKYISKTTVWSILHRDWNLTWKVCPLLFQLHLDHSLTCCMAPGFGTARHPNQRVRRHPVCQRAQQLELVQVQHPLPGRSVL